MEWSLHHFHLRNVPRTCQRLLRGVKAILYGAMGAVIAGLALGAAAKWAAQQLWVIRIGQVAEIVFLTIFLIGIFLISRKDPIAPAPCDPRFTRIVSRVCGAIFVFSVIALLRTPPDPAGSLLVLLSMLAAAGVVGFTGKLIVQCAQRAGAEQLSKKLNRSRTVLTSLFGVILISTAISAVLLVNSSYQRIVELMWPIAGIAVMVALWWAGVLLSQLRVLVRTLAAVDAKGED